ncbi:hypothetical protein JXA12_01315 [Candidatus Woesearchaeota archaeon]|nr:hypothetical protein [Candidatus Woesearchaeota archaeon]
MAVLGHIRRRGAQLGDDALGNVKKSLRRMSGGISARRAYQTAISNAKSGHLHVVHDKKGVRRALHMIHVSLKHADAISDGKQLGRLQERYRDDEKRLRRRIDTLIRPFPGYLRDFADGLHLFVMSINDLLVNTNKELGVDNELVLGLLADYKNVLEKTGVRVLPETLKGVLKELVALERKEKKYAKKEEKLDKRFLKEDERGRAHHGHIGVGKVFRLGLKAEKAFLDDARRNLDEMQQSLTRGHADQAFLASYLKHLKNFKKLAKIHKKIALDILELLGMADDYFKQIEDVVASFETFFKTYTDTEKTTRELEDIKKRHEELVTTVKNDIESQKEEYYLARKTLARSKDLLQEIAAVSEKSLRAEQERIAA